MPCKANNAQVIINAFQNRVCAEYGLPELIILNRAGSLKGNQMRAYLEAYDICPEFVAADNHRANGLAEQMIREFTDRMNLTCKDHWKTWHKTIKDTELSLRTNPNEDTGILPAKRLVAARLQDVNKFTDQQPLTQPHKPHMHAYTFQRGEQVLFKTHNGGSI